MGNSNDTKAEQERQAQSIIDELRQANKIPPDPKPAPGDREWAEVVTSLAKAIIEISKTGDAVKYLALAEAAKTYAAKYL
jgi:hypothetical protein